MKEAIRQEIHGIHVLRYPDNSIYVDVAERVRLVHQTKKPFSFERGEIQRINTVWIYRAFITVGEQQYIGDAEIRFGEPLDTPDGTNPISCGQTSAIGNALTFAGFGDVPGLLERLGKQVNDEEKEESSPDSPYQVIEGIHVVMLDGYPYVPVAERLRLLHQTSLPFSIEACEVHEYNKVWIYRAFILVNGKRYIGDAEIFFHAPEQTFDGRYPVTCGQTSAVGNALTLAGFGDVHSILERQGKNVEGLSLEPRLASADAVFRAKRYAEAERRKRQPPGKRTEAVPQATEPSGKTPAVVQPKAVPAQITPAQCERIRILCERLGEAEPAEINEMTETEAEQLIERLKALEEELFGALDDALHGEEAETEAVPLPQAQEMVNYTEIGHLKTAWMGAFRISGQKSDIRQKWRQFKKRICKVEVDDDTMTRAQYNQLNTAIEQQRQRETQLRDRASTATSGVKSS